MHRARNRGTLPMHRAHVEYCVHRGHAGIGASAESRQLIWSLLMRSLLIGLL